jgi:hypothetical protein
LAIFEILRGEETKHEAANCYCAVPRLEPYNKGSFVFIAAEKRKIGVGDDVIIKDSKKKCRKAYIKEIWVNDKSYSDLICEEKTKVGLLISLKLSKTCEVLLKDL